MNEEAESNNNNSSRTKVYGAKLKSARISLQKSVEEMATELNLHPNVIIAIEEMHEDKLPNAVFVKGYIRTYAKFVQIDADELVKDFSDVDETAIIIEEAAKANKEFNFEPNLKLSMAVIAVIVILFSVFSFQEETEDNTTSETELSTTANETDTADAIPAGIDQQQTSENTEVNTSETSEPAIIIEQAESADSNTVIVAQATENKTATEAIKAEAPAGLLISVDDDVWMEIRNEKDKRLYSNVLKKGNSKFLPLTARYKLNIGRSSMVKMELLGKPIDFSSFTKRKGISRFDLTKEGELQVYSYKAPPKKPKPVEATPDVTVETTSEL